MRRHWTFALLFACTAIAARPVAADALCRTMCAEDADSCRMGCSHERSKKKRDACNRACAKREDDCTKRCIDLEPPAPALPSGEAAPALPPPPLRVDIERRRPMIDACYQREVRQTPAPAGAIDVTFRVGPDGKLADVTAKESGPAMAPVARCAESVMRAWRVRPLPAGPTTFHYHVAFTAAQHAQ